MGGAYADVQQIVLESRILVIVHSYILVGRFHARMKICLHECTKGAPINEQK